jgi:2-phosphosulfolactate phosphatase
MTVDLVSLPRELRDRHLTDRAVVVFDVLRATTTITAALSQGAAEVRVFDSLASAASASRSFPGPKLLCGERECLPPPGFDLGNSPIDFTAGRVSGRTIFMCTTNGTRAIVAARAAGRLFAGALVNASATARALAELGADVTLLGAGTAGDAAPEDLFAAGAVVAAIKSIRTIDMSSEAAKALTLFENSRSRPRDFLRLTTGGRNVIAAGLERDIDFAADIDRFDIAVEIAGSPPVATARRI